MLWTGFPEAFSAVMTTLYIPLALAALGIVLRGANFAFRHVVHGDHAEVGHPRVRRLLDPDAVLHGHGGGSDRLGRGPRRTGDGDPTASWTGPLPLLIGAMFVATGGYIAAVFLVQDARNAGEPAVESHFRRCAMGVAVVAGALAVAGVFALRSDARYVYDGLTGPGLPLVIASGLAGIGALALLVRGAGDRLESLALRPLAVGAVAMVVWGWGVGQHPYLLPPEGGSDGLTIDAAAAPDPTHGRDPDRVRSCRAADPAGDRAALRAEPAQPARVGVGSPSRGCDRAVRIGSSR